MTLPAPLPANEAARLAALRPFEFLRDLQAEPAFRAALDGLVDVVRDLLAVQCAVVSLVFETEQVFIGRANCRHAKSSRDVAFAAYTLLDDEPLVVPDASQDPRFRDNPFVTGPDHVRFYAGFPLDWGAGLRLGALTMFDTEPRELASHERRALLKLSAIAVDKLRALLGERALRAQAATLRQTEALAHVGNWEVDLRTMQLAWSEQMYRIHGMTPGAEVTVDMTKALYATDTGFEMARRYVKVLAKGGRFEMDVAFFTAQGNLRYGMMVGEALAGSTVVFGSLRDVTDEREAQAKLTAASLYDPLTGLPNRVLFEQRLAELVEPSGGALVVVGLDDLQAINDLRGRDVGNRVLREAAYRLVAAVGSANVVARVGDHEFGIFVADGAGTKLAEYELALRQAFDEPFQGLDEAVATTASLGVATIDHGRDAVAALAGGEIALHHARTQGRNRIAYFAPELRAERERESALLADIRRGIGQREFILHYQPICDVAGRGRGFEALMRWNHPLRGLLAPFHFLAGFADPDLSLALGDVALREAMAQMRAWHAAGLDFGYVAVNVSAAQFERPEFAAEVSSLLRVHGLSPVSLVLEVTETVYLDAKAGRIADVLRELRAAGVSLALDDFGTGHASLTHLRQFPIDKIKIDQSFIRELEQNPGDAEIVRAMVSLGKSLGMQVVAEGVETAAQIAFLSGLGCDLIQGYYFSKPHAAADVAHFCALRVPKRAAVSVPEHDAPPSELATARMPPSSLRADLRRALWRE